MIFRIKSNNGIDYTEYDVQRVLDIHYGRNSLDVTRLTISEDDLPLRDLIILKKV
jgi:hypothetical protein